MTNKEMKSFVEEMWKKTVELGETNYSSEVLAFAYMLGLAPDECTGMYVESDWEPEWIIDYNRLVILIDKVRK